MTLEKVLHTAKIRTTGSWKDIFMKHPLLRLVFVTLLAAQAAPNTAWAQVQAAPPIPGVIGKDSDEDWSFGNGRAQFLTGELAPERSVA